MKIKKFKIGFITIFKTVAYSKDTVKKQKLTKKQKKIAKLNAEITKLEGAK